MVMKARRTAEAAGAPPRLYFAYSTILDRSAFVAWRTQHGYELFDLPAPEPAEAFHSAALRMGASDEGPPGIRARYGPGYYAAFVRDPDGYRLEAVCHQSHEGRT